MLTYNSIGIPLPESGKATNAWTLSSTGHVISLRHPVSDDIDIRDIAHHLSLTCRFGGACREFYSVARHSIFVCGAVSPENQLWGLLHDAAEAYIGDWIRPIKHDYSPELHHIIQELENRILKVIARKYNLPWPMPREVKDADDRMLATEMRDLMPPPPLAVMPDEIIPFDNRVSGDGDWHWTERDFLARFRGLFVEP